MNIYLDIDGVLIANELNASLHANDFLRKVLTDSSRESSGAHLNLFHSDTEELNNSNIFFV